MALPGSHVFFLPAPQQEAGPLAEMDQCRLPSPAEQAQKTTRAMNHLHAYVESCGGKLLDGWDCKLRFRTTTRRNSRLGLTTDNYYYSPCGKTFRSHKQPP
ncbi:hypothetical protein OEZ86_004656 [Tetradesmus obliquus]|nr:hypothetical protein OEZ86_004656 [Tetradesmus obliquus]